MSQAQRTKQIIKNLTR